MSGKLKIVCSVFVVGYLLLPALSSASESNKVNYALPDINGVMRNVSDYQGKWVVLNFWATWCPPCQKEIPELVNFYDNHHGKDATVIGVDYEDIKVEDLRQFSDSYFMSYPILRTSPTVKTPFGVITGLPTTFLISPSGELVAQQNGPVTAQMIEDFINEQPKQSKK